MKLRSILLATVTAASLAAACSSGIDASEAGTLASSPLEASVRTAWQAETFSVSGSVDTSGSRRVVLERRDGDDWRRVDVAAQRTNGAGGFTFGDVSVDRRTTFRAVTSDDDARIVSRSTTVGHSAKNQSGELAALPRIGGTSSTRPADADAAAPVLDARFTPAREGRAVRFEARQGGRWVQVATGEQDAGGRASAVVPDGSSDASSWRAVTEARHGLAATTSAAAGPSLADPTIDEEFTAPGSPAGWSHRLADRWLPGRTCGFSTPGQVSFPGSVGRFHTTPTTRRPSGLAGDAPSPKKFRSSCRDASGRPIYVAGSMMMSGSEQAPTTFTHGVAAARIKFDRRPGQHGAFWLQTNTQDDAEIDVVESFGRDRRPLSVGLHLTRGDKVTAVQEKVGAKIPTGPDDDWYRRFHIFSVEWTAQQYVFRVDGREVMRSTRGPSSAPHYVILSNFAGDWEIPFHRGGRATMDVDWVRVWQ